MKSLIKNETEFTEYIEGFKSDKMYGRHCLDAKPESYPCICVINTDTNYFGDHIIEIIDFIYPSDF